MAMRVAPNPPTYSGIGALTTIGISTDPTPRPSVVSGDTMLWFYGGHAFVGAPPATTAPSGWTLQASVANAADWLYVYSKIAGGSEPSTYNGLTTPTSGVQSAAIVAYTGTNPTTPVDGTPTTSDATVASVLRFPSASPAGSASLMVMIGKSVSSMTSGTPPAGANERHDSLGAGGGISFYVCDLQLAASGATGTKDAAVTGTVEGLTASICLTA
jgi:hypothetical protein